MRAEWAEVQNRHLRQHLGPDAPQVSEKTYAAQGEDRVPGVHLGPEATAMERRGVQTELGGQNKRAKVINGDKDAKDLALDRQMKTAALEVRPTLQIAEEVRRLRAQMTQQRDAWQAERDALRPPRAPSAKSLEAALTKREAGNLKKARARQAQVEQSSAKAAGTTLRRVRQWAKNPMKALMKAVRDAEAALAKKRAWVRGDAGQAHIANVREPARRAAAEMATKRRTLDRKIKRIDVRIKAAGRVIGDLHLAHELNAKTLVVPAQVARDGRQNADQKRQIAALSPPARVHLAKFPKPVILKAVARLKLGQSVHSQPQNLPDIGLGR